MLKKIGLFIVSFIIVFMVVGCSGNANKYLKLADEQIEAGNLIGAMEVIVEGMEHSKSDKLIEKANYISDHVVMIVNDRYDEGNLTSSTKYDSQGNQLHHWKYNEVGHTEWGWEYFHTYDDNKNCVRTDSTQYTPYGDIVNTHTEYTHDSNGNVIKKVHYNSKGYVTEYYEYLYDSNNNKVNEKRYNNDDELEEETTWKYDGFGNTTHRENKNYNGEYTSSMNGREYIYDEHGSVITELSYSYSNIGDSSSKYIYEYTYDKNGFPIEQVMKRNKEIYYVTQLSHDANGTLRVRDEVDPEDGYRVVEEYNVFGDCISYMEYDGEDLESETTYEYEYIFVE